MANNKITEVQEQQKAIWEAEQRCPVHMVFCSYRTRQTPDNLLGCKKHTPETKYDCLKYSREKRE